MIFNLMIYSCLLKSCLHVRKCDSFQILISISTQDMLCFIDLCTIFVKQNCYFACDQNSRAAIMKKGRSMIRHGGRFAVFRHKLRVDRNI